MNLNKVIVDTMKTTSGITKEYYAVHDHGSAATSKYYLVFRILATDMGDIDISAAPLLLATQHRFVASVMSSLKSRSFMSTLVLLLNSMVMFRLPHA